MKRMSLDYFSRYSSLHMMNPSLSAVNTLNDFLIHFNFVPFLRVQSENMGKKCWCRHRLTTEYHYLITL